MWNNLFEEAATTENKEKEMVYVKQEDRLAVLEAQLAASNKEIGEAQGAIRRLAQEGSNNITLIAGLREDLADLKRALDAVKNQQSTDRFKYDGSATQYE